MDTNQILDDIAAYSSSLELRCRWIKDEISKLKTRPQWPTHAEDALEHVEIYLRKTLTEITEARQSFAKKPQQEVA